VNSLAVSTICVCAGKYKLFGVVSVNLSDYACFTPNLLYINNYKSKKKAPKFETTKNNKQNIEDFLLFPFTNLRKLDI
jgi:hypothetical protein